MRGARGWRLTKYSSKIRERPRHWRWEEWEGWEAGVLKHIVIKLERLER